MVEKVEVDAIWLERIKTTLKEALETEMHHDMVGYIETVIAEVDEQKPSLENIELPEKDTMAKKCCGDTEVFEDIDGQVRCSTCKNKVYDYI